MAKYRKLSRTSDQRKALLRSQVTSLLYHGKIVTTEAKAKEIRKIAEGLVAMAVREKDNFETVTVTAKVARKDAEGKRVKEVVDGKKKTVYDEVQKEIKKDAPSRLHARRQMMKVFYPVKEVPAKGAGRKKNTKDIDMTKKMFEEIAPKYAGRNGGYQTAFAYWDIGKASVMTVVMLVFMLLVSFVQYGGMDRHTHYDN